MALGQSPKRLKLRVGRMVSMGCPLFKVLIHTALLVLAVQSSAGDGSSHCERPSKSQGSGSIGARAWMSAGPQPAGGRAGHMSAC